MEGLVLVTGGNRGLGFEVCKKLVSAGSRVLLTSRDPAAGEKACARIESSTGRKGACTPLQLDQSDLGSVASLVGVVKKTHDQKITGLINNGGMFIEPWDEKSFDLGKRTNYIGPTQLTVKLAPHLASGCRIVMVSSGMGQLFDVPQDGWYTKAIRASTSLLEMDNFEFREQDPISTLYAPVYRVTKAMLNRATQILSEDPKLTSRNHTVNSCCPGWCRSPEEGADSILYFLKLPEPVNGTFKRNGTPLPW